MAIRPPEALTHSEILTWPLGETDCHANAAALARNDAVGSMPQKVNAIAARIYKIHLDLQNADGKMSYYCIGSWRRRETPRERMRHTL